MNKMYDIHNTSILLTTNVGKLARTPAACCYYYCCYYYYDYYYYYHGYDYCLYTYMYTYTYTYTCIHVCIYNYITL